VAASSFLVLAFLSRESLQHRRSMKVRQLGEIARTVSIRDRGR
jgi:hypothetical protein